MFFLKVFYLCPEGLGERDSTRLHDVDLLLIGEIAAINT